MSETIENFKEASEVQLVAALSFQRTTSQFGIQMLHTATQTRILTQSLAGISGQLQILQLSITTLGRGFHTLLRDVTNPIHNFASILIKSTLDIQNNLSKGFADTSTKAFKEAMKIEDLFPKVIPTGGSESRGAGNLLQPFFDSLQAFKGGMDTLRFNIGAGRRQAGLRGLQGGTKGRLASTGVGRFLGGIKGGISPISGAVGGLGKSFAKGLSTLGPQMLALTLVMKPIQALLSALLEPLDPIIDIFGTVGDILGLLLVPIVNSLMQVLIPILPGLLQMVNILSPIISALVLPLTLLGQAMQAVGPIMQALTSPIEGLSIKLQGLVDNITGIGAGIAEKIKSPFEDLRTAILDNTSAVNKNTETVDFQQEDIFKNIERAEELGISSRDIQRFNA
jgi:hypothetical protein